jgi:hypothetical protein
MSAAASKFDAYWMPFTANRDFKENPRLITAAEGHYYTAADGTRIYDTFSGLWTSGVGHCHPKIVEAVQQQVASLDYCMAFQMGHEKAFELADRVVNMAPLYELGLGIGGYGAKDCIGLSPCTGRRKPYPLDRPREGLSRRQFRRHVRRRHRPESQGLQRQPDSRS